MEKIKVLQVNKLYFPATGGIEHVVRQLAEGLQKDTKTEVLVCQKKGKGAEEVRNGVKVHRASSLGVFCSMPISFSFLWKFRKLAKDKDVVQLHAPFPLGDLACYLSGYRGKVFLWWHSDIVRQKRLMRIIKPLTAWMLKRADVIVVATEGHIEGSDYLKPYRQKCVVIPYGVPQVEAPQTTRERIPVQFLFVGRLVSYKGCAVLLRALQKVPNAELTLVGNGTMKEELESLARELQLGERVTFQHNLNDRQVAEEFQKCDVFVLPSITKAEAFGIVQIEAMAWSKPVINTWLPSGVPHVSLDGITGITVEPENVDALAEAMKKMIECPKMRKQMGEAARARVQECFLENDMLEKVLRVYQGG